MGNASPGHSVGCQVRRLGVALVGRLGRADDRRQVTNEKEVESKVADEDENAGDTVPTKHCFRT